jgi:hypothetical protein
MTSRIVDVRRTWVVAACALAICAAAPAAAGVNLSWNDCGAFGISATRLACTSNVGKLTLVLSVTPQSDVPLALTMETLIDIGTSGAAISPWWDMRNRNGCRANSCSAGFSFGNLANCEDPWMGLAIGGYDYAISPLSDTDNNNPNRARIYAVCALPSASPVRLEAGKEYYLCEVLIDMAKTVGVGSCPGCTDDAIFTAQYAKISEPDGSPDGNPTYTTTDNGSCVRTNAFPTAEQCSSLPVRNRTWGSLKAMYR